MENNVPKKVEAKEIDGVTTVDPQNNYWNPEKELNTSTEDWAVVMTAGGPRKVRMGTSSADTTDQSIESLEAKQSNGTLTVEETEQLEKLKEKRENEINGMLDQNRSTRVTALPNDFNEIEQVISEGNIVKAPKEIKRSE